MNDAILSGVFVMLGITLGWVLNEVGVSRRYWSERRRREREEADARVFDAADAATRVSLGVRRLVEHDVFKAAAGGEGISHQSYEETVLEIAAELQRLRMTPMLIAAKGPSDSLTAVEALVNDAQALWDTWGPAPRREVVASPEPFMQHCDQLAEAARLLAQTVHDGRA